MFLTVTSKYSSRLQKFFKYLVLLAMAVTPWLWLVSCRSAGVNQVSPELASTQGYRLFSEHCASCHGTNGMGDGEAAIALKIQPRDFWHEPFRYVSTLPPVPTDGDLIQTIRSGRRFGEMPAGPQLTDAQVQSLADFVRELNKLGWVQRLSQDVDQDEELTSEEIQEIASERVSPGEAIAVVRPGIELRPDTAVGHELYMAGCASCHGPTGRGDGLDKPMDERGKPIRVRDLTSGEFRGGGTPEEVFKRIRCGVPGTPMPVQENMTDQEVWQLVYYVRFLAGQRR